MLKNEVATGNTIDLNLIQHIILDTIMDCKHFVSVMPVMSELSMDEFITAVVDIILEKNILSPLTVEKEIGNLFELGLEVLTQLNSLGLFSEVTLTCLSVSNNIALVLVNKYNTGNEEWFLN
jgi:hypothetical protein